MNYGFESAVYPGPRSGLPPSWPVTLLCSSETTPFTKTYSMPTEGRCGSSNVAMSLTVAGSKMVMSANAPARHI
jgi:hypothetical protein